jgi:hypothetical protein
LFFARQYANEQLYDVQQLLARQGASEHEDAFFSGVWHWRLYTARVRNSKDNLLPVPRITITRGISLTPTHEGALLRAAVPTHALLLVNAGIGVEPDDLIARTMPLCRGLRVEQLELADCRNDERSAWRGERGSGE